MADTATHIQIGPDDHGSLMPLDDFAHAEGQPGAQYELERGVILVVDIPGVPHMLAVQAIRDALASYRMGHRSEVYAVVEGGSMAIRMPGMQSERHPDIAVYLSPPPTDSEQPWDHWTPDIVVEVVSKSSEKRDYEIKRDEYLKAGVRCYWIVDPVARGGTILTRRGDTWSEQKLDSTATISTSLLPGFTLRTADVLAAADRNQ